MDCCSSVDTANCNANPDFIPVASGGDGSTVQFCELAHVPITEANETSFSCRVCWLLAIAKYSYCHPPRYQPDPDVRYSLALPFK